MTILSVAKDVCLAVGVNPLTSMFAASIQPRTQAEMLSLANEMAQRIAYDVREWTQLRTYAELFGDGIADNVVLPANFKRMLLTTNVRRSSTPSIVLRFISDFDEWQHRRENNITTGVGEWIIHQDRMYIYPILANGEKASFGYLDKNCVVLGSGGHGDTFQADTDRYRLDERLLKLGMTWQWMANKGSPYAEAMGTYTDALMMLAGADKPAPIIVNRVPISQAANVALPWPVGWGQAP